MQFIPPDRLQEAILKAKYDLGSMLSKSLVNCPSGTSTCCTKVTVRDAISTLPNSSQDQTRNSIKAKPIIQKQKSYTPCNKDLSFSDVNIKAEPCISHNSSLSTNTSGLHRPQLQYNEELTEEDLKWLGKNYSSQLSRRPVINNINLKSRMSNECSLLPMSSTATSKYHNRIHETALDFINRVQMREQQLWKQLAEISVTPLPSGSSTRSSSALENYEPILPNLPKEQDIFTEIPGRRDCKEMSSTQHSHEMLMDAESLVSLLGEEWLKNLLREELEMSNVE